MKTAPVVLRIAFETFIHSDPSKCKAFLELIVETPVCGCCAAVDWVKSY